MRNSSFLVPFHQLSTVLRRGAQLSASDIYGTRVQKQKKWDRRDQFGNMGYMPIQTQKLETRHPFRRENPSIIIEDKWDHFEVSSNVPVIDTPMIGRRHRPKAAKASAEKSQKPSNSPTGKPIIECARKEFNHYEGMNYSNLPDIPLVSQSWHKEKYAGDWFTIHRTTKVHSTLHDSYDRAWEEFQQLIHPEIYKNIMEMNFKAPTKIQYDFFKSYGYSDHKFMAGETGSGKTLAYGATILSNLLFKRKDSSNEKALILTPGGHLNTQTVEKLRQLAENTSLKVAGMDKKEGLSANDFDVLVSTPRLAYNVLKQLSNSVSIRYFVIDESDLILDDRFVSEMTDLLSLIPVKSRSKDGAQLIFSSATCPPELTSLVDEVIIDQNIYYVVSKNLHKVLPNIQQKFVRVLEKDKLERVVEIITNANLSKHRILIFCRNSKTAEFVSKKLSEMYGFSNALLRSNTNNTLDVFEKENRILVSSDSASRGLDIPDLTHIINYDFPRYLVDYIHKIGRVGRCNAETNKHYVISFVTLKSEVENVKVIESAVRLNKAIQGIETNITGLQKERKLEIKEEMEYDSC